VPRSRRKDSAARGARRHRPPPEAEAPAEESGPVARGIWSGSISFGLVTIPIELYPAARREGVAMRMLGPDGVPLARVFVCPEENRVLSDQEITRAYPLEDGKFVVVSEEELEELAPRRSRDIELTRFVDRDEIDPVYFVSTYLILPGQGKIKAYRLLAETMEESGRAGLADFVMRGKAHAVAILADGGLLRAVTLRYSDELRSAEAMGISAPGRADSGRVSEIKRAIQQRKESEIDERELTDDSAERLKRLAREKLARGADVVTAPEAAAEDAEAEAGGEVIDLVDLIRKSLRTQPRRPARRAGSQPSQRKPRKVASRSQGRGRGRAS
jgi:DNA end-binding protein Ku